MVAETTPQPASDLPADPEPPDQLASDTELLSVTVLQHEHAVLEAYVAGEVDMITGPSLQRHFDTALATRPERLIVDLSQVSFLGSTGLAVLINARTAAIQQGTTLQLRSISRATARPLQVTGLIDLFEIVPAEERPSG